MLSDEEPKSVCDRVLLPIEGLGEGCLSLDEDLKDVLARYCGEEGERAGVVGEKTNPRFGEGGSVA